MPPFQIGEYTVAKYRDIWRVYMRAQFTKACRAPLFETPRKREALEHARYLERNRKHIARVAADDPVAVAENYKCVMQLRRKEQES